MQFTTGAYRSLLELLREQRYTFTDYHDEHLDRCVILRHDVDFRLAPAVSMAEIEAKAGVKSTYFVLLRTNFYNPASADSLAAMRHIQKLGHEIGLHFDETAFPAGTPEETAAHILYERDILSAILETPITTVSMHRPSKATLEADLQIPGMVNSYGQTFFHDFKYLSDSRRCWREPVEEILHSGAFDRLHILTHPFWYHEEEQDISQSLSAFVNGANHERYVSLADNLTDLDTVLKESEVR